MNYISHININDTDYAIKDAEARELISSLANGIVFKGVVSSEVEISGLADYKVGWAYKANAEFTFTGLGKIEIGDMLICTADKETDFNASDWTVLQNNVDIFEGATDIEDGTSGLVPSPVAGDENKFLKGDGTWGNIDIVVHTIDTNIVYTNWTNDKEYIVNDNSIKKDSYGTISIGKIDAAFEAAHPNWKIDIAKANIKQIAQSDGSITLKANGPIPSYDFPIQIEILATKITNV